MFTRRNQLWWLIILSAITALAQYVVQGATASGHNPAEFVSYFWYADYGLWGARALIEAWVIVYLFQTKAETWGQSVVITSFEIGLIGLITLTLGPAFRSLGYGILMRESLSEPWFTFWNFGIAAYTSLMMGAAGYAYRVQPADGQSDELAELQSELAQAQSDTEYMQSELTRAQGELEAARAAVQSASDFIAMSPQQQVSWIAEHRNGDGTPTNQELAEIYGVHPATVGRWIAQGRENEK